MNEVRLIDANALKYKNLAEVNGKLTYVLTAEEIDNAPTVPLPNFKEGYKQAIIDGKTNYSRPHDEWILVSERLPEEHVCEDGYHEPSKWVLVQTRSGHMYTTRYWTRDKKNVWTDLEYPEDIIAWQPLPEPYEKGGAE